MKNEFVRYRSIKVFVKGPYIAVLNALNKKGATLYGIKKTENGIEFGISSRDLYILKEICDEREVEFSVVEKRDTISKINKKGYDLCLFCGMTVAAVFMLLCSLISVDYYVEENPVFNYREIKNMGTGCEIHMFRYNSTAKIDRLKELILSADGVADCDVCKKGNIIKVTISASLEPEVNEKTHRNTDVVSMYDAEVTKIVCRSGTSAASVGDQIKSGDTLVKASYTIGEESYPINVDCEVYGKVTMVENYVIPEKSISYSFGKYVLCGRSLHLFGKELFNSSFTGDQIEKYEKVIDIFGILNVGIHKTYCRDLIEQESVLTEDYIEKNVIPRLTEKMHTEYDDRFEDVDVEIFEKTVDNNIIIDVYYTGITRIDSGG